MSGSFNAAAYLDTLNMFGIRLGLEPVRELAARAGDPQRDLKFIHIAGTNGKGSTAAMLEAALRSAGLHTGLYTSPHLLDVRERFRIDGRAVTVEEFNTAARELADEAGENRYSYFEFATVLAMKLFRRARVDAVIWETGMGGRLDATNVVTPVLTIITNIALDHQKHLGNTLAAIAGEKAGILKPGVPLCHGVLPPEAREVIAARAAALGVRVIPPRFPVPELLEAPPEAQLFQYDGRTIRLSLPGKLQRENFRIVYHALCELAPVLGFSLDRALAGVATVRWPARLQRVGGIFIDGGHNPDGAAALTAALRELAPGRKYVIVYAAFQDKDAAGCLEYLSTIAEKFIFTVLPVPSRPFHSQQELGAMADRLHAAWESSPDVESALLRAKQLDDEKGRVLAAGSLFLAGEVLKLLHEEQRVLDLA